MGGPAQPVHDVRPALSGSRADVQQERVVWQRARAQLLEHGCNTRRVEGATVRHTRELARRGAAEGLSLVHCSSCAVQARHYTERWHRQRGLFAYRDRCAVEPGHPLCESLPHGLPRPGSRSTSLGAAGVAVCFPSLCTGATSSGCKAATPLFIPLWCPPTVTPRVQVELVLRNAAMRQNEVSQNFCQEGAARAGARTTARRHRLGLGAQAYRANLSR